MGQKVNPLGFRLGYSQKHISHWFVDNNNYSQLVVEDQFIRKFFIEKFPDIACIHIKRDLNKIEIEIFSANTRTLLIEESKENNTLPLRTNKTQLTQNQYPEQRETRGTQNRLNSSPYPANSLCDQLLKKLTIYRNTSFLKRKFQGKNQTNINTNEVNGVTGESSNKAALYSQPELHSEKTTKPVFDPQMELGIAKKPIEIALLLTKVENPSTSAACIAEFIVEQLEKRVPFRRVLKRAIQKAEEAAVEGIKVQISGRLNGAEIARSERIHKGQVPLHTLRAKIEYNSRTAKTIYGLLGVKVWVFHGFANLNE